jgi:hypothetical protein
MEGDKSLSESAKKHRLDTGGDRRNDRVLLAMMTRIEHAEHVILCRVHTLTDKTRPKQSER